MQLRAVPFNANVASEQRHTIFPSPRRGEEKLMIINKSCHTFCVILKRAWCIFKMVGYIQNLSDVRIHHFTNLRFRIGVRNDNLFTIHRSLFPHSLISLKPMSYACCSMLTNVTNSSRMLKFHV